MFRWIQAIRFDSRAVQVSLDRIIFVSRRRQPAPASGQNWQKKQVTRFAGPRLAPTAQHFVPDCIRLPKKPGLLWISFATRPRQLVQIDVAAT